MTAEKKRSMLAKEQYPVAHATIGDSSGRLKRRGRQGEARASTSHHTMLLRRPGRECEADPRPPPATGPPLPGTFAPFPRCRGYSRRYYSTLLLTAHPRQSSGDLIYLQSSVNHLELRMLLCGPILKNPHVSKR